MGNSGLQRYLERGVRFGQNLFASTYVGLRVNGSVASSFYLNLPTALPTSTQAIVVNTSGDMSFQALSGGGTVTSVGLALPSIFSVTGTPITSNGSLAATLASQTFNTFFAAPNASSGTPTFRSLVSGDIPQTLTSSWITNFDTAVRTNRLDQMAVPTASVNLNSQKIINLATPTLANDASTKSYVDSFNKPTIYATYQLASGTDSGAAIAGWNTLPINTEILDTANSCTISNNRLTLVAGTYEFFDVWIRLFSVNAVGIAFAIKLRNITDSTDVGGLICMGSYTNSGEVYASISGRFAIASTKTFEIQVNFSSATPVYSWGVTHSLGTEVYAKVGLKKII